tara:strand:- start:1132 stop:2016 length:885 start_codon:yes stop_codon:yes gene_type:complete
MSTDTLVSDIYRMIDTKEIPEGVPVEQVINDFGENVKEILRNNITEHEFDKRKLRMSNIGKKDRQLWYSYNGYEGEKLLPHTRIKFLYGHLIEEMVLALTKLAGHDVTHEQKQVEVDGIKGSMDCKIDGVLTDVKSASSYGFKKFKDGSLVNDDPFGYIDQIKGYAHAEGTTDIGWLVMDKTNGHLTYLKYDMADESQWYWSKLNFFSIPERIKNIKKVVESDTPPERCYKAIPDGKSGNMKLPVGCSYCAYKHDCWGEDLRTFLYSNGPRYLTQVVHLPNVIEVDRDGNKVSQ